MRRSQPVIERLVKILGEKFTVSTESDNKFNFDDAYYSPDLVIRNKDNNKILAIIEVELGTRKHIVGGVITADYCMGLLGEKPNFYILALEKQDKKDYLKRVIMLKSYIRNLKDILVGDENFVIQHIMKLY